MLEWVIILIVLAISITAYFIRNVALRIFAIIFLVAVLVLRDLSTDLYLRTSLWEERTQQLNPEEYQTFKNGAHEIIDFCQKTRLHIFGIYGIIILLYFRSIRKSGTNDRDQIT